MSRWTLYHCIAFMTQETTFQTTVVVVVLLECLALMFFYSEFGSFSFSQGLPGVDDINAIILLFSDVCCVSDQIRQDVEHILMVISENHKALSNVVAVLTSLQDEVHSLRETVRRRQSTTFHIQPPAPGGHASATSPTSQTGPAGGGAYYGPAVTHQTPVSSSSALVRGGGQKRSYESRRDSIILSLGGHGDKPLRH